jgi:hypothetical protein
MAKGIDLNFNCSDHLGDIAAAGIDFVCRYYANGKKAKIVTQAEAQAIGAAGLQLVVVWEDGSPTSGAYFSYAKGVDDATSAFHDALSIGQPTTAPIYFAVDFDASQAELAGSIRDYFRGIAAGMAASAAGSDSYPVGVYGSGLSCQYLINQGLATFAWLSQSTGFRGSRDFTAWNIKQGQEATLAGLDVDTDEGADDYGGFGVA